jgi:hypothetical protein
VSTSFTLTIDRTSLSLSSLVIGADPADGYVLDPNFGPGRRQWDRVTAESPWVHGRAVTSSRMLVSEMVGTIYVISLEQSAATLGSRVDALVDTLSQLSYTVTFTHTEGVTSQAWSWTCEPADIDPGDNGVFVDYQLAALCQPFTVHIPRSPIPLAGPI